MNISVITVVFNGARTIHDCLESVHRQTCQVEQIIVDGGSTDGTLEIINECAEKMEVVVSEPDNGIYDAMNKGLRMATGDIVGCLNADDMLAHDRVLCQIAAVFADPTVDVCYGDLVYIDPNDLSKVIRYWHSGVVTERHFRMGLMPAHPTFYIRRTALKRIKLFNLSLLSANDFEFTLRCLLLHRMKAVYLPNVLVKMRTGGVSNRSVKNVILQNKAIFQILRMHGLNPHPLYPLGKFWSKAKQYLMVPKHI